MDENIDQEELAGRVGKALSEFIDDQAPLNERYYVLGARHVLKKFGLVQADERSQDHVECDCVPDLGPSHCHSCSEKAGREVEWTQARWIHGIAKIASQIEPSITSLREAVQALEEAAEGDSNDAEIEAGQNVRDEALGLAELLERAISE